MSQKPLVSIKGLLQAFGFLSVLSALMLALGFILFVRHVDKPPRDMTGVKASGIVVLTGRGDDRLNAAASLLNANHAERLLISGVNPNVDRDDLRGIVDLSDENFACCVDLGYEAEDTLGNAYETLNWVESLGYESIILVTSDYHMPRAKAELAKVMGGVKIIAHPVRLENPAPKWWSDAPRRRILMREYLKLLVSFTRRPGQRPAAPVGVIETPPTPVDTGGE